MTSLSVLRARAHEERAALYREAANLCGRFGVERDPEPPAIRISSVEEQAHADRGLVLDLIKVVAALADAQEAAPVGRSRVASRDAARGL